MDRASESQAPPILLAALIFVLGLEMVRFHVASLGWYQRDTLGVGALDLIPVAVVPFSLGILLPVLSWVMSLRACLWLGVSIVVGARLVTQVVIEPAADHWASGVGVAAFFGSLMVLVGLGRSVMVAGVLLGVTLDSAIKAQGASLDLAYRPGLAALVAVLVMSAAALYLVATADIGSRVGPGWRGGVTLVGLGPFLFVQYLVLQSQGWVSEVIGIRSEVAALAIVALNLVALWLATRVDPSPAITALATVVVGAAAITAEGPPLLFGILVFGAIPAAGLLWAALVPDLRRHSIAPSSLYLLVASLVFLGVGFAYYLPLDLHLGITQAQVRIFGAALLMAFGLAAVFRRPAGALGIPARAVPMLAVVTLLLSASALVGNRTLSPPPESGPLRVMSYNIHQSFGTGGEMDVDEVARVILDSGATVVGVQELARGGLLNAGTDLLALLGHRLGWEHVAYFGTTDPVWGNAILSRYPLGEIERVYLPTQGTPFRRGYLAAPVDTPIGTVLFVNTHLQHVNDADDHAVDPEADLYPVHEAQLDVVLREWDSRRPAVLVGDLNARPEWRQVEEVVAAGWVDSWAAAGSGPGYTANAADPEYRIDYVFHTLDLETVWVGVIESQASDHFAVVADVSTE
ncbi:hypothetical protein BH23ACT5_BH23ACT5_01230 [soil metagenome]